MKLEKQELIDKDSVTTDYRYSVVNAEEEILNIIRDNNLESYSIISRLLTKLLEKKIINPFEMSEILDVSGLDDPNYYWLFKMTK
jgi:hypothetical protein